MGSCNGCCGCTGLGPLPECIANLCTGGENFELACEPSTVHIDCPPTENYDYPVCGVVDECNNCVIEPDPECGIYDNVNGLMGVTMTMGCNDEGGGVYVDANGDICDFIGCDENCCSTGACVEEHQYYWDADGDGLGEGSATWICDSIADESPCQSGSQGWCSSFDAGDIENCFSNELDCNGDCIPTASAPEWLDSGNQSYDCGSSTSWVNQYNVDMHSGCALNDSNAPSVSGDGECPISYCYGGNSGNPEPCRLGCDGGYATPTTEAVSDVCGTCHGGCGDTWSDGCGDAEWQCNVYNGLPNQLPVDYSDGCNSSTSFCCFNIDDDWCNCLGAVADECGECGGVGIVFPACDCDGNEAPAGETCEGGCLSGNVDCLGICDGDAELDQCNVCGGDDTSCTDCAGVVNPCGAPNTTLWPACEFSAYVDECDICVGGTTDTIPCVIDCTGTWGGDGEVDDCGVCNGGNSSCTDCADVVNGNNVMSDNCGCIGPDIGNENDPTYCNDCAGTPEGDAVVDECGVCGGSGILDGYCDCITLYDCAGECGGSAGGSAAAQP
jgi:hypothetical protein